MTRTTTALLVGLVLGLAAAFGGIGPMLIVALFGALGLLVGMVLDGRIDLSALLGRATDRR